LFAHGEDDDFIDPSHSKKLSEKYCGDHNLIMVGGDHNSERPRFFYDSVSIFFNNNLLVDSDFGDDNELIEEKYQDSPSVKYNSYSDEYGMYGGGSDLNDLELAKQLSLMDSKVEKFNNVNEEEDIDEDLRMAIEMSKLYTNYE